MSAAARIMLIHGPNLNLLGKREPEIYGYDTLADVEARARKRAKARGFEIVFRQSNYEGELVTWIQEAREKAAALVLNPAGYTHTSVAIHDALKLLSIPVIELHLSNLHKREAFRSHSYVSSAATGIVAGFGPAGYAIAMEAAADLLG